MSREARGGRQIYSRPAKCGNLAVALAFTAGTLLVGAQPGYASKPHLAAAVGDITEYPVPTAHSGPYGIAAGPDGNLWFTELSGNQVAKVTTAGAVTEYPVPGSGPPVIAAGPDGNLWFTELSANQVAKVTTAGVVTEYAIPTAFSTPSGIAAGPDGNLWFTENGGNKIAKVTTAGVVTEYLIPTAGAAPNGIAAGPDGNLWFTEGGSGMQVAKVTTSGVFTEYPVPTANSTPIDIVAGPDGNLWFTEINANQVAKVTTAGVVTEYPIPTAGSGPNGIAAGPDGNLWLTEQSGNQVAKVTTAGVVTEYPVPTANSTPIDIAAGPDGNLWFTERAGNNVAKIVSGVAAPSTWVAGVVGANGGLYSLANGASSFTADGGVLLGAPAVVSIPQTSGPGLPLYIATGTDHDLYVRSDTKGWQHLTTSHAFCIDNPAGVVIGSTLYVACQGSDHALWHAETPAPSGTNLPTISSAWQSLGGVLVAGPSVAAVAGTPTYVVVGSGNQVYQRTLTTGYSAISNWRCTGHPALAASGTTTFFACHGLDGALYYATNTGGGWSAAQSLGGLLTDGPGIAAPASGPIFFAEGGDHALYHRSIAGPWIKDGGQLQYGAGAAAL